MWWCHVHSLHERATLHFHTLPAGPLPILLSGGSVWNAGVESTWKEITFWECSDYFPGSSGEDMVGKCAVLHLCYRMPNSKLNMTRKQPTYSGEGLHLWSSSTKHSNSVWESTGCQCHGGQVDRGSDTSNGVASIKLMGTGTWGAKIWIVPIPTGSEEPWHVSNNNSHFLFLSMEDMKFSLMVYWTIRNMKR